MFVFWRFGFFGSFPKKVIISKSEGLDEKGVNSGYSECTFLKGCIRADSLVQIIGNPRSK